MTISRREFIKLGAAFGAMLTASACSPAARQLTRRNQPSAVPALDGDLRRLLNRAGFGPSPANIATAAEVGYTGWLEQQLDPASITDTRANLAVRHLAYYDLDIAQLLTKDHRDVMREVAISTFVRAVYSERQLYETMVHFWSDHFNIYMDKSKYTPPLKLVDDREAIRPHALGTFRDLLFASAQSPAMLTYLDNVQNRREAPNENYARELMELHTLGINGGYTQTDVEELARALTGWTVAQNGRQQGQFVFEVEQHDDGPKRILGRNFPGNGGQQEIYDILDMLASHPSTAEFIATKLVRRFVADDPPAALVVQVRDAFTATDGDIKTMLRVIFTSDAFRQAPPRIKRPFHFTVSALRGLGADIGSRAYQRLAVWLNRMGQLPFLWPMPDGYPVEGEAWLGNLLPRWNFCAALANGIDGVNLPLETFADADTPAAALEQLHTLLTGTALAPEAASQMARLISGDQRNPNVQRQVMAALILASPTFQQH